ncbi:hypothetical protein TeGR_g13036 [Tetraparma gracilis]|uniref:Uncharacterized protein n=1 Tax=Tetraparma gracilis TaxID=2962635 RepID=A0ABQ6M7L4_9STRA|nr:hypothetical protein TeGR_g13036 [Tetraparma gracilis]
MAVSLSDPPLLSLQACSLALPCAAGRAAPAASSPLDGLAASASFSPAVPLATTSLACRASLFAPAASPFSAPPSPFASSYRLDVLSASAPLSVSPAPAPEAAGTRSLLAAAVAASALLVVLVPALVS